eukprot:scaffold105970_cov43-Attheya_sp.AAC.3
MIHLCNNSDKDEKNLGKLVANPTKFKNDTHFPSWNHKLTDNLGDKLEKTGTPLSYVIRADDAVPDAAILITAIAMRLTKRQSRALTLTYHPMKWITVVCRDCCWNCAKKEAMCGPS